MTCLLGLLLCFVLLFLENIYLLSPKWDMLLYVSNGNKLNGFKQGKQYSKKYSAG